MGIFWKLPYILGLTIIYTRFTVLSFPESILTFNWNFKSYDFTFLNNVLRLLAACFCVLYVRTDICGFHVFCTYALRYAYIKTSHKKIPPFSKVS